MNRGDRGVAAALVGAAGMWLCACSARADVVANWNFNALAAPVPSVVSADAGGGSVFVTVQRARDDVEILIEDDGAGISADNRDRLFNRGVRLDASKPGTGLGLAIVRDVAEIYGGSISLEQSEDMGGLLARLRLPLAA